ncbi:hypothetical protein N2152v2_000930 [Parachlorella kessleri]
MPSAAGAAREEQHKAAVTLKKWAQLMTVETLPSHIAGKSCLSPGVAEQAREEEAATPVPKGSRRWLLWVTHSMEGAVACLGGGALAAMVLQQQGSCARPFCRSMEVACITVPTGVEGGSQHSSCTEAALPGRLADSGDQQQSGHKTHHLLRHCLNMGQKQQALEHFNAQDVKEAAKEISRMGQRELQGKFKLVYGNTTHSNNNNWLRRKLFEAIGAAPLKANSKGSKSRKSQSSGHKKDRTHHGHHSTLHHSQKHGQQAHRAAAAAAAPASVAAGQACGLMVVTGAGGMHQPVMVPTSVTTLRCSPKPFGLGATASLPVAFAASPKHSSAPVRAGAPRRMASYPASPVTGGMSVLDACHHESALSRETSDSDDGSHEGSQWEEGCSEEAQLNSGSVGSSSSSPYAAARALSTGSAGLELGEAAAGAHQQPHLHHQQALVGLGALDIAMAEAGQDAWMRDDWGDDVLASFALGPAEPAAPCAGPAAPAGAPTLGTPSPASTSLVDDDDEAMLLPLDLSAIDTFAFA